jgi:enoyl-CoA hydratase/carnithine racemase
MTEHIRSIVRSNVGNLLLDRPKALNSLSLPMVRTISSALRSWRDDADVKAVLIRSTSERAFCAGGDIRFFYEAGHATPAGGSALLEDFFTEEYALNHLVYHYPKPYIALMDGIVMGGGMGISQAGPSNRLRIVTERTKMAMPEVNIGLFPDVGGSHFLSRSPGNLGAYLAVTGATIGADDALYCGLADVYLPLASLPELADIVESAALTSDVRGTILEFARSAGAPDAVEPGMLASNRAMIDHHFSGGSIPGIMDSLRTDSSPFAVQALSMMRQRSPLMMCVTLAQIRRGALLDISDCLRMERTMVRRCFEHGEILEGVRARVIDKDNAPLWNPASVEAVSPQLVERFFEPAWPAYAHPLRDLD